MLFYLFTSAVFYQRSYQANWELATSDITEVIDSNPIQAWIFFNYEFAKWPAPS